MPEHRHRSRAREAIDRGDFEGAPGGLRADHGGPHRDRLAPVPTAHPRPVPGARGWEIADLPGRGRQGMRAAHRTEHHRRVRARRPLAVHRRLPAGSPSSCAISRTTGSSRRATARRRRCRRCPCRSGAGAGLDPGRARPRRSIRDSCKTCSISQPRTRRSTARRPRARRRPGRPRVPPRLGSATPWARGCRGRRHRRGEPRRLVCRGRTENPI